ncbi:MAG TPA: glycosyl transferase family 2, partial [Phaeodactylibacter sp.]|nr:glycosyl transferase family 2 [Phaeodactylibacter sp.]
KIFNRYHLGFLDKNKTHEIDVLAGAFMLLRKSVLDKIGWLDEAFFMYGEDIDLSYRIVKAGYKNYYFADTTIIHYKGESTKKGSLNYVKVFYNAMIIFARKHFVGEKAKLFILMLHGAIYFRAFLTVTSNFFKKIYLPLMDAVLMLGGLFLLKNFWASIYYDDPDYYQSAYLWFNFPLYITIWLSGIYFSGGYDEKYNIRRLVRGVFMGSLLLAAVYGFLDLQYRPSRALIVMGAVWVLFSTVLVRMFLHFLEYKNINIGKKEQRNVVIVGSKKESDRVMDLLNQARVNINLIGTVAPSGEEDAEVYLSNLERLDEVVHIYKIHEIIFCSKDVFAQNIMKWMTRLGSGLDYKIVPEKSLSIIGSNSKNTVGELYTIDIRFQISEDMNRRNKRVIDWCLSLLFIVLLVPLFFLVKNKMGLIKNIYQVLFGKKSWVGYATKNNEVSTENLPKIKTGVLSPLDALKVEQFNVPTIQRLNFLYAKDYEAMDDLEIIWKGMRKLGRTADGGRLTADD